MHHARMLWNGEGKKKGTRVSSRFQDKAPAENNMVSCNLCLRNASGVFAMWNLGNATVLIAYQRHENKECWYGILPPK